MVYRIRRWFQLEAEADLVGISSDATSVCIFITEPKGHATELRRYMRDPDGYLIELGETTMTAGPLDLYV